MDKEQELRCCPFCGGEATLERVPETMIADCTDAVVRCGNCDALGPPILYERETGQDDPHPEAIAAWNRRSSSDEQRAEVVAWQWQQCKSLQPGVWPEQWNNIELRPGEDRTQYWRDLAARIPDEVRVRPLYASPVATGGVTEDALSEILSEEVARQQWTFSCDIDFDKLARAAPAVRDEGMREGGAEPFLTGRGWENLSCDDQFALATRIAANIGYELVAEAEHPDSPHNRAHAVSTPILKGEGV